MSFEFNPLVKKGFDKVRDNSDLISDTAYGVSWDGVTSVAPSKNAIYDVISGLAGGHDAVTLDVNADTILSLTDQELGLDTQVANTVFAGPDAGAAAVPTFRALVADDIPDLSGTYLTAESDPDFTAWLLATPPLYPGGWYDADQNTINLSGFNNDSGFITSYTDEKVKYDAGDATAGYIADKIIAGTGIGVAEGSGADVNKLVVSSTITQYTDALAVTAIKADAAWKATDWDTAYGWGNHALAGYVTGTPWTSEGYLTEETDPIFSAWDKSTGISITESQISDFGTYLTDITGESIGDLSDVTLTPTKTLTITESTTLSGGTHSGTNTGDQVIPDNEAGSANNFLTAYNNATGAWTKAQPTWANIDKTTSDIADLTTKSHTSLSDIGTLTHATIDSYLDQAVKTTSSPTFVNPVATTAFLPDANDGATLGTSALQFSDLYLAEGGNIDWDNGDAKLTQVGDVLTLSGAYFSSANGISVGSPEAPSAGRIYASSVIGVFCNGSAQGSFRSWSDTAGYGAMVSFYRQRGTYASEATMQDGDLVGGFYGYSKDTGGTQRNGATYKMLADGNPTASSAPMRHEFQISNVTKLALYASGSVVIGSGALATNATSGFLYIPSCAGTPTGTPTAYTGRVAMVFDTTNNKLYVYDGSWIDVT